MRKGRALFLLIIMLTFPLFTLLAETGLAEYDNYELKENGCIIKTKTNQKVFIRPYGSFMVRFQYAKPDNEFLPDDYYDIITDHQMGGKLKVDDKSEKVIIETKHENGIRIIAHKKPLHFSFYDKKTDELLLEEKKGVNWDGSVIENDFQPKDEEHFLGLGHKPYGYQENVDLQGLTARRNYMENAVNGMAQGNLLVPFYMSSEGYGIYMNSMFPNEFSFNDNGKYSMSFDTQGEKGQMDFVFIKGPGFDQILDRYTQLTGRPRLLPKSMFGLQISDQGANPLDRTKDNTWWKEMIKKHRKAGLPLDHAIYDNAWRPGITPEQDGERVGTKFKFNPDRYPDPQAFGNFLDEYGVTLTLDVNLNNYNDSWGWREEYNIPVVDSGCTIEKSNSYPDFTNPMVRDWVWELFWNKALNPELDYPCDGLWMDGLDFIANECVPDSTILSNGRTWGEMKNYYYFLVVKAAVQEGWLNEDSSGKHLEDSKRPYIWQRGGTAGGQRYGTHWTGDINTSQKSYQGQIISMQASGLSGFPYFNHDAGAFAPTSGSGPSDEVYRQWGMAFGSFTPIWRPHGYGRTRWPMSRSEKCQESAKKYGKLRYKLMPYIYTMAHIANQTGMPMARSMSLMYPNTKEAWEHKLQYMWGSEMLVAPGLNLSGKDSVQKVWLPDGNDWYYFWDDEKIDGGQIIEHNVVFAELPVFVKTGAVIPKRKYAQSTFWLSDSYLILDVYSGDDGEFLLQEDDGVSARYRTKDEIRKTKIVYKDSDKKLTVYPAKGSYKYASKDRKYELRVHGLKSPEKVTLNGQSIDVIKTGDSTPAPEYAKWNEDQGILVIKSKTYPVNKKLTVTIE